MKLRVTRTAMADMRQAYTYVAEHDVGAAKQLIATIQNAFERLRSFPESGRPGRFAGTRELVIPRTSYVAPYRMDGDTVTILAVVHGRKRWPSSLPE